MKMQARFGLVAIGVAALAAPAIAQQADGPPTSTSGQRDVLGPRPDPAEPIPATELEAFLDGLIEQTMALEHIAGVTVSVVQQGQVVVNKGYGYADIASGRRVDPDTTLFRIGSITKTFTWIALMRRVERGEIDLDDPINDHLPVELQIPDQGFAEPIRVRHLMTHSPGFEDRALGSLFATEESLRPLQRYLAEDRVDRVRGPGEFSTYSNYGVGLAGAILEHVDGRRWQEIIEAEIFAPLGLDHTTGREPYARRDDLPEPMAAALAADVSTGYRWVGVDYQPAQYEYITPVAPAGAMSSTAGDMARYMLILLGDGALDGTRIFATSTARAFRTPMTDWPPEVGNWAAGFFDVLLPGGLHGYGHGGATLTFFADMTVVPDLDLGIFVATNTAGGGVLSNGVAFQVLRHFYTRMPDAPPEGLPSLRQTASDYIGTYRGTRRRYSGLEGFLMRAASAAPVTVNPDGFLVAAIVGPPSRFLPTDVPGLFRSVDRPAGIKFEQDESGAVRIASMGQSFERIGLLDSPQLVGALSILTLLISLVVLGTLIARRGYAVANSPRQQLACHLRAAASLAWLVAMVGAGLTLMRAIGDVSPLIYEWPTPGIVVFSVSALAAAVASVAIVGLLPVVWRGEPGTQSWTVWRKLRFTLAVLIFVALAAMLAWWGALEPWNP